MTDGASNSFVHEMHQKAEQWRWDCLKLVFVYVIVKTICVPNSVRVYLQRALQHCAGSPVCCPMPPVRLPTSDRGETSWATLAKRIPAGQMLLPKDLWSHVVTPLLCSNKIRLNEKLWHPSGEMRVNGSAAKNSKRQRQRVAVCLMEGLVSSAAASGRWKENTGLSKFSSGGGLERAALPLWGLMFFPWVDGWQQGRPLLCWHSWLMQ